MNVTIETCHGTILSAQPDGTMQVRDRTQVGAWEIFTVHEVGTDPKPPDPDELPLQGALDDHEFFTKLVQGKPFGQQTVLDLEPTFIANNWKLTKPNADGDRTKVFGAKTQKWIRVGFGEGFWVWYEQS